MQTQKACKPYVHNLSAGVLLAALAAGCFLEADSSLGGVSAENPDSYQYSSEETNKAVGRDLERELSRYRREGLLNRATPNFAQVRRVFNQLAQVADKEPVNASAIDWVLHVHAGRAAEAYARAGGQIVLSEPFLDRYHLNDNELALVIGHEMVHAICEHERLQLSAILRNSGPHALQIRDVIALLGGEEPDAVPDLPLIRRLENIADREGLRLAVRAGFSPTAAVEFFDKLELLDRDPGFFPPTHDSPARRRSHLQQENFWLSLFPGMFHSTKVNCRS